MQYVEHHQIFSASRQIRSFFLFCLLERTLRYLHTTREHHIFTSQLIIHPKRMASNCR